MRATAICSRRAALDARSSPLRGSRTSTTARNTARSDFPHRDYVLVCSSDARETLKRDDRKRFVDWALGIAQGRRVLFKLHPNEDAERARRELRLWAPRVEVYSSGPTNAMIANASVLVTQYSTVAFVGLALGKEVHSYHPVEELRPPHTRAERLRGEADRRGLSRSPGWFDEAQRSATRGAALLEETKCPTQ